MKMKLGVAACTQLAALICGDKGIPFPYRTGRELSLFFTGLGHGYRIEDFSSRGQLAENALIDIDNKFDDKNSDSLSNEMVEILEELMSPIAFDSSYDDEVNYAKAMKVINRTLNRLNLQIVKVNGTPMVQSTEGIVVSTASASIKSANKLMFAPSVFQIPDDPEPKDDLVSVMIPFQPAAFDVIFETIKSCCSTRKLRCLRVKDMWKESQIIQDIFELILASSTVIVDFSESNNNVFYEAGIAHTLGKEVIPIAQSIKHDVPFDLQSHRVIEYQNSREGLKSLSSRLGKRLDTIVGGHDWSSVITDDVPF